VDNGVPVLVVVAQRVVAQRQRPEFLQVPQLVRLHDVIDAVPVQVQHLQVREQQEFLREKRYGRERVSRDTRCTINRLLYKLSYCMSCIIFMKI